MTSKTNRRIAKPKTDKELYQSKQIKKFIKNERRHDELSRLREVKVQKRVWMRTVVISALINIIFISIAIIGITK